MFLQVAATCKLLLTHIADERFHAGVRQQVKFQLMSPSKPSLAPIAGKRPFAGMPQHMLLQVMTPGKFPTAHLNQIHLQQERASNTDDLNIPKKPV